MIVGFGVQGLRDLSRTQTLQFGMQAPKPDQEMDWNVAMKHL